MGLMDKITNFSKDVVSDTLNLSDLCKVVPPSKYAEAMCDDLALNDERIFILLKSKTEEFCFTETSLIHASKNAAVERRIEIKRYNYTNTIITNVQLVTAARIDLSVELEFKLNDVKKVIAIDRRYTEILKSIYKVLVEIEITQGRAVDDFKNIKTSLEYASQSMGKLVNNSADSLMSIYRKIYEFNSSTLLTEYDHYLGYDYSELFERYLTNN